MYISAHRFDFIMYTMRMRLTCVQMKLYFAERIWFYCTKQSYRIQTTCSLDFFFLETYTNPIWKVCTQRELFLHILSTFGESQE